ncbi:MAG: ribosome maturation factor RimP [Lachnospiraceae bacterium]|nr:ribosome maturation factor RimP [Lachnospiraceae bacterium]
MGRRADHEAGTEALVQPILDRYGFELWSVEYVKEGDENYLRVYIDKEGGITIDDCVTVSRELSDKLDEKDFIPDAYILEVSSPGLGRILKKDRELEHSIGRNVDVKTYKPLDGSKMFSGTLQSFDEDKLSIETPDGSTREFARADIAKISLSIDL